MTYPQKVAFVNNANPNNPNFRQQVEAAVAKQAIYTLDGGGAPTAPMQAHALAALANPAAEVNRFAWYCAYDGTLEGIVDAGNAPTDTQVQAVVDAKRNVAWGV
jgi:hypothetical protein